MYLLAQPIDFINMLTVHLSQWVELSAKDQRQKVDRAFRDAKKFSASQAATRSGSSMPHEESSAPMAIICETSMLTAAERATYDPYCTSLLDHFTPSIHLPQSTTVPSGFRHSCPSSMPSFDNSYLTGVGGGESSSTSKSYPPNSDESSFEKPPLLEAQTSYRLADKLIAPQLEYSCGSLMYDSISDVARVGEFSESRVRWGASASGDMNRSASISGMDFSAISLDLYSAIDEQDRLQSNQETMLFARHSDSIAVDSAGASMDIGSCFRLGGADASNNALTSYQGKRGGNHNTQENTSSSSNGDLSADRYSQLKREESDATIVTRPRRRGSRDCDNQLLVNEDSLAESFNISLDLSAIPRPPAARRETRRRAFRAQHCVDINSTGAHTIDSQIQAQNDYYNP